MRQSQYLINKLSEYIKDITAIPVYGVISADVKTLPRIEIELVSEKRAHICLASAKEIVLNIKYVSNTKDADSESMQDDLENLLIDYDSLIDGCNDEELTIDEWRLSGGDLEIADKHLIISWQAETWIQ